MRIANPTSRTRSRQARGGIAALALVAALGVPATARPAASRTEGLGVSVPRATEILRGRTLHTLDGATIALGSLQGQVVVLSFWATWCAPCRRELPKLDALHDRLARSGGRVIAISIDEDRQNVDHFVTKNALHLPVVQDGPDGLARALDLRHVPLTIVLDRAGNIAMTSSAADESGLDALAAATGDLAAGRPLAATPREGGRR